jgi:hypothetical protein
MEASSAVVPPGLLPPVPVLTLPASARHGAPDKAAEAMMYCAPTPTDLGLPEPSLDDIVERLTSVPFEAAMLLCSLVAAVVFHHPRDRERHQALSDELHAPWLAERMRAFLAEDESHLIFDERHVAALQRLLISHAAADRRGLTTEELGYVMGALLAMASALPQLEPPMDPDVPPADLPPDKVDWPGWATFTVRAGAWYDEPYIADAIARAHSFYIDVHGSTDMAEHAARCDVAAWGAESVGLTLAQQLAGALACAIVSRALEPTVPVTQRAVHLEPGFLSQGAMAELEPQLRAVISGSREELAGMLDRTGHEPSRIAWDHTVFEQRPFLRLPDDSMRLISPRGLVSWMTRGIHHRTLQAAERHPHPRKRGRTMTDLYLTYAGALGEGCVRRLLRASHRVSEQAGLVRLHGEHAYRVGKGKHQSPDAALDYGTDLILVEVYSGRISLRARAEADPELMLTAINQATTTKLTELAARTQELLDGYLTYSDLQLGFVRRIWPLLVLPGDPVMQTPALWAYIRQAAPEAFSEDARVQRPTITDLDDLEPMLAQVERGVPLPELLAEFSTSIYAELPPRSIRA